MVLVVVLLPMNAAVITSGRIPWYVGVVLAGVPAGLAPQVVISYFAASRLPRLGARDIRLVRLTRSWAVMIPFSRTMCYAYMALLANAVVVLLAAACYAGATPHDGSFKGACIRALVFVFPLLAIVLAASLIRVVIALREGSALALTPDGVFHWSWFGSCFYHWDWIRDVRARSQEFPRLPSGLKLPMEIFVQLSVAEPHGIRLEPEESLTARWNYFRGRMEQISVKYLSVHPTVPYYALEFYRRHPELRHELGTQEGVERIRSCDLSEVTEEVRERGAFAHQAPNIRRIREELRAAFARVNSARTHGGQEGSAPNTDG